MNLQDITAVFAEGTEIHVATANGDLYPLNEDPSIFARDFVAQAGPAAAAKVPAIFPDIQGPARQTNLLALSQVG